MIMDMTDLAFYISLGIIAAIIATVLIVRAVKRHRLAKNYGIVAKPLTKEEVRAENAATGNGQFPASGLAFSALHVAAGGVNAMKPMGGQSVPSAVAGIEAYRALEISEAAKEKREER